MNVYSISTMYKKHMVVAKNMAEAEKAYLKEYSWLTIRSITLESENVIIAEVEK